MKPNRGSMVAWLLWGIAPFALPGVLPAATPPALTNYQGVLRGSSDEPLTGDFDMVFRFFDAASAGNEILVDQHLAAGLQAVTVDGGLFSVALGGGQVSDGAGPGSFASLAEVFRDHSEVWLEVQIGAETLTPRTRVLAAGYALNAANAATAGAAGTATNATLLDGKPATFYLDTSATRQTKNGGARFTAADSAGYVLEAVTQPGSPGAFYAQGANAGCILATATNGIQCGGNTYGGYNYDANDYSYAYTGYGAYGIYTAGSTFGTYSQAWGPTGTGVHASGPQYGVYASATGSSGVGLLAIGATGAHFNQTGLSTSYLKLMYSGYGLWTTSYNGIHGWDENDGGYSRIGSAPYKIVGNGSVSFVQNHPDDPDKVVVYHAPESSEVNVYTRGSARLVKGTARVALDPTFAWTANPEVGLTAHLTPRGEAVALAVESVSATEIVVRGPAGSDVSFDYWVTGLRIGFEEMPAVTRKEIDAQIPRNADAAEIYAADPELRAFNGLERHRAMARDLGRSVDPDMKATATLRNRIGVHRAIAGVPGDAGVPGEESRAALQMMQGNAAAPAAAGPDAPGAGPTVPAGVPVPDTAVVPAPSAPPDQGEPAARRAHDPRPSGPAESPAESRDRSSERFAAASAIDSGDVVVLDRDGRGAVRRSDREDDRGVVGVALTAAVGGWVEVAVGAVTQVRVDAGFGAIRAGDLLVSSPAPGAAMRAKSNEAGTILGKALEPLESGLGTIRILVTLR